MQTRAMTNYLSLVHKLCESDKPVWEVFETPEGFQVYTELLELWNNMSAVEQEQTDTLLFKELNTNNVDGLALTDRAIKRTFSMWSRT